MLDASVAKITGDPHGRARPGQRTLSHDIAAAMLSGRYLGGEAPTGSEKGLAYLAPAMLLAAVAGHRAVISTETLGPQAQIIDKDAPVIAAAVSEALVRPPSVAVPKGWANFACGAAVASTLGEMVDTEVASTAALSGAAAGLAAGGATVRTPPLAGRGRDATARKDSTNSDGLVELVTWAAGQIADDGPGDRGSYPGSVTEADWQQVSVTPAECPGAARCRFGESCRPAKARVGAAGADIVVTNHPMLATQAARSVPVVLGNETLGDFAHLVVDETHALPAKVRDQGSVRHVPRRQGRRRVPGRLSAPGVSTTAPPIEHGAEAKPISSAAPGATLSIVLVHHRLRQPVDVPPAPGHERGGGSIREVQTESSKRLQSRSTLHTDDL